MGQSLIIISGSGSDFYNFLARNLAVGFAKDQELAVLAGKGYCLVK
jgi:hypothetical protein